MGRNNIGRGVSPEKYDLRSTIYEVSKATATAQDTHTYKLAVEPNSYFVIHTSHFPSPLVGRNNIGRGVSPCSWSKTYPSPMSVATRPTDTYSVGREPGAGRGSGLTPLGGLCRPPRDARRALYYDLMESRGRARTACTLDRLPMLFRPSTGLSNSGVNMEGSCTSETKF